MKLIKEILTYFFGVISAIFISLFIVAIFLQGPLLLKLFILLTILLIICFYAIREISLGRKKKDKEKLKYERKWMNKEFDDFMGDELLDLRLDYIMLLRDINYSKQKYSDYSFVIVPMAKVLEGFLKKVLLKLKIIKLSDLKLDPNLSINNFFHPKEGKINEFISDRRYKTLPSIVYSVYQECRNEILHYDLIDNVKIYSLDNVKFTYQRIEDAIIKTYEVLIIKTK